MSTFRAYQLTSIEDLSYIPHLIPKDELKGKVLIPISEKGKVLIYHGTVKQYKSLLQATTAESPVRTPRSVF